MTDELITMLAKNTGWASCPIPPLCNIRRFTVPCRMWPANWESTASSKARWNARGDRVHINAQLIYAPQDRHLWAESYDRDLNDLGSLQSELARTIASEVGLTAIPPARPVHLSNLKARDAYMLGRYYWVSGDTAKGREISLKSFNFSRIMRLLMPRSPTPIWPRWCLGGLSRSFRMR